MNLGQRISALRTSRGLTQAELAEKVGVGRTTVASWEQGIRGVKNSDLQKLADIFQVSLDYLCGRVQQPQDPLPNELPSGVWPLGSIVKVPVIGTIRAGAPVLAEQNIIAWEEVPSDAVRDGDYFYLRVTGDSMNGARIMEDDLVLVRLQPDVDDGDIAVVMVGIEEATLKRVRKQNGTVALWPENPKYRPMLVRTSDVRIVGKVMEVKFTPK